MEKGNLLASKTDVILCPVGSGFEFEGINKLAVVNYKYFMTYFNGFNAKLHSLFIFEWIKIFKITLL